MALDKFIFIFIPVIILINYYVIKNYNLLFLQKTKDKDFLKPQAFHTKLTPRIGGLLIFFFLILFSSFFFNKIFFFTKIIFLGTLFFLLGFIEDVKFNMKPELRLFFMLTLSFVIIFFFDIKIVNTQLSILNNLINNYKIFSSIFVVLCFLFIVNGSNFIDGFNGLLIIHSIIILSILYFVNFQNNNIDYLRYFIMLLLIICFSLLFYNFPKAKIFLGDGGAYLLGTVISLIIIELSNLNKTISPFFFAGILFYIFFEVFFSFFRKIIFYGLSPLKPDKKHLHMLFFKLVFFKIKNFEKANYLTGLLINIFYFFLIMPLLFYYQDKRFCEMYFLFLLIVYLLSYLYLNKKINKKF